MAVGVDTNVLLRAAASDDVAQTTAVRRLFSDLQGRGERLHVNLVVLAECVWVMDRSHRMRREAIADWLDALLENQDIDVAQADAVAHAVRRYRESRLGFADVLIGVLNRQAGCSSTYSFDRRAAGSDLFTLVPVG